MYFLLQNNQRIEKVLTYFKTIFVGFVQKILDGFMCFGKKIKMLASAFDK